MKEDFLKYQAQTTPHPFYLEVSHAKGSYIYNTNQKEYLDFVAGVSATTLGHCHPKVSEAIKKQTDKYLHSMVYGEFAMQPSVELCKLLASKLPKKLSKTYLVNSGTEAIEASMKLAKRVTRRKEIISAKRAYHGNTQGSLSLSDYKQRTLPFEPLLPNIHHIEFNNDDDISKITQKTACVILETIQGGAGFIEPTNNYLKKVSERCKEVGALLILDEIQTGFGRTGKLFGFENYDVIPDVLVIGKGFGNGVPVGAFCTSEKLMAKLSDNPKLGHITTFGGNPLIASACLATLKELNNSTLIDETLEKEKLIRELLVHPKIKKIRGKGLMLALILDSAETANEIILKSKEKGLILFWLLFEPKAVRITPPLTISKEEIKKGCDIILSILNK